MSRQAYEALSPQERKEQDRLDREERERRDAEQDKLAAQEAVNYVRTHDAEAAEQYAALTATMSEIHEPENEE